MTTSVIKTTLKTLPGRKWSSASSSSSSHGDPSSFQSCAPDAWVKSGSNRYSRSYYCFWCFLTYLWSKLGYKVMCLIVLLLYIPSSFCYWCLFCLPSLRIASPILLSAPSRKSVPCSHLVPLPVFPRLPQYPSLLTPFLLTNRPPSEIAHQFSLCYGFFVFLLLRTVCSGKRVAGGKR